MEQEEEIMKKTLSSLVKNLFSCKISIAQLNPDWIRFLKQPFNVILLGSNVSFFSSCADGYKPIRHVVAQAHWVGSKPIRN